MGALGPLVAALLVLQPRLTPELATEYADIVTHQARRRGLDPLLLVAYVQVESGWDAMKISPTYDWGLGAIHVSRHSFPELRAREWVLFFPIRNLRATADLMAMWRDYHNRMCRERHRGRAHGDFIEHMKFGRRIGKSTGHAERVRALEARLRNHISGLTGVQTSTSAVRVLVVHGAEPPHLEAL